MFPKFNNKRLSAKILWLLGVIILLLFVFWRISQVSPPANLLTNPDFETGELTGWQVVSSGANVTPKPACDDSENTVLALDIPVGKGGGIGQRVPISPLRRYKFMANYRSAQAGSYSTKIVLRVSQFDQQGQLIKEEEFLKPEQLTSNLAADAKHFTWNSLDYKLITDEQAAAVEIGLGFLGDQVLVLEIDHLLLQPYPTWLGVIRDDGVAWSALLLLAAILIYQVSWLLWPLKRKLVVNTGLAFVSLLLTLIIIEIIANFVPIQLMSWARIWPKGYYVPFNEGNSYRLAKNYPSTLYTFTNGDKTSTQLIMSNSIGVRDVELPSPADHKVIVLVLGDSMTFGMGIRDINDTWPRRLQDQMANMSPSLARYHFVNAGVSAYNTFQEVLLFETLIKEMEQQGVKPDIVLLSFYAGIWDRNLYGPEGRFNVVNDVLVYNSFRRAILNLPGRLIAQSSFDDLKLLGSTRINHLNHWHQTLLYKSRLYFILSILLTNRFGGEDWMKSDADYDNAAFATSQALGLFKQVAEANNVHPLVVFLPGHFSFESEFSDINKEVRQQLSTICQNFALPLIDPYEDMQKLGINGDNAKEKLTLGYDLHYSPAGNLLYVQALAPLLADYLNQLETIQGSAQ